MAMQRMLSTLFSRNQSRHSATRPQSRSRQRQWYHLWLAVVLLALVIWLILAVRPPTLPGVRPGYPSPVSIRAPRTFTYESELRTEQERARAESSSDTLVYQTFPNVLSDQRTQMLNLFQTISQIRDDPSLSAAAKREKLTALPSSDVVISPELAAQILELSTDEWNSVRTRALLLYDRAMERYSYEIDEQDVEELRTRSLPYWSHQEGTESQQNLVQLFTSSFLKPNRVLDQEATNQQRALAREAVKPVEVQVLEGESIVREGDVITPEIEERLEAIGIVQLEDNWRRFTSRGVLAAIVALAFGIYLSLEHTRVWSNDRPLMVVIGLFALTLLAARMFLPLISNAAYMFPLAAAGILIAALFSRQLALFTIMLLVMLIMYLRNGQFDVGASLLFGSLAGIFAIGRPERSLTFLRTGVIVAVVTALSQFMLTLPNIVMVTAEQSVPILTFSSMNGLLSAILALGLYNALGNLAGITTPFQLMELAHPSRPLLRKLMREAPGTYYHSIAVGNLAESAAEAIGADALLLRVAAYYHDIGKTIRPYFFTDNQSDRENVHNEIDPQTSAEIIADHVREGVTMAQAAGLPRELVDFIPTHHGTSVIKHFYQLALQQEDAVNEERFRYPGPKPQSREQAILMLADTVEATVRSKAQNGKLLSARAAGGMNSNGNGGKQTLEELVASIIDERVRSGQLDESDLTLQDIARIRQAFTNTLQGIYHPRVEYTPQVVKH